MINNAILHRLDGYFEHCIREDIGEGDHTSRACIPEGVRGKAVLIAKEEGRAAGLPLAPYLLKKFDPKAKVHFFKSDGDLLSAGEPVLEVEGEVQAILSAERLILNFLQRLCGIASQTARYVAIASKYGVGVADTRKTTPGMRVLEKAAVKAGGGMNHRMGLYDMIMIKDNHVDFSGSITAAVQRVVQYLERHKKKLPIEVEARNLAEVEEALATAKVDVIMLDNFTPELCREAVTRIGGKCKVEASGNITLENLQEYAATGIDYLSTGALTHSVKSLDLSLKAAFEKPFN